MAILWNPGVLNRLRCGKRLGMEVTPHSSTTTVSCAFVSTKPLKYKCTATVKGNSGVPTGTVIWSDSVAGGLSSTSCTLSKGSCYVYGDLAVAPQVITAYYQGSSTYGGSSGSYTIKATPV